MSVRIAPALVALAILAAGCADNGPREMPAAQATVTTVPKLGVKDEPIVQQTVVERPIVVEAPAPVGRPISE